MKLFLEVSWWEGLVSATGGWSWVLYLWWAGLCQGVCLEMTIDSGRLQAACLLVGGAVFLPRWLFGLRHPTTDAFGLLGGAGSWHQSGSIQDSSHQWIPSTSTTNVLVSTVSQSRHLPPWEALQDQQVGLAQAPMKSLLFPLGPGVHDNLACALQKWHFCFSQFCAVPVIKLHWLSKSNTLGAPSPDARLGSLMSDSELSCGRTSVI